MVVEEELERIPNRIHRDLRIFSCFNFQLSQGNMKMISGKLINNLIREPRVGEYIFFKCSLFNKTILECSEVASSVAL
jgi:hypothetical protein